MIELKSANGTVHRVIAERVKVTPYGVIHRDTDKRIGLTKIFGNAIGLDYVRTAMLQDIKWDASHKDEFYGVVLDTQSIRLERVTDMNSPLKGIMYRMTVIGMVPIRDPEFVRPVDLAVFKDGATFRSLSGSFVVAYAGRTITTAGGRRLDQVVSFDNDGDFPLQLLWEPDEDMTYGEINKADYDEETGMPWITKVIKENGIYSALGDGAL
jgi:hypothetical protein